jgi:hypothetical protein
MKDYLIAKCEGNDEKMRKLEEQMMQAPKCFDPGSDQNVLIQADASFEDVCTVMQENGVTEPKKLTEYEFYAKLKYYEKRFKPK